MARQRKDGRPATPKIFKSNSVGDCEFKRLVEELSASDQFRGIDLKVIEGAAWLYAEFRDEKNDFKTRRDALKSYAEIAEKYGATEKARLKIKSEARKEAEDELAGSGWLGGL